MRPINSLVVKSEEIEPGRCSVEPVGLELGNLGDRMVFTDVQLVDRELAA